MTITAPSLLTIAGTDPCSGAGIQVDLQVFARLGFHGTSVITALLWQNTRTVSGWHIPPAEIVAAQLDTILSDITPAAIKIGVLPSPEIVEVVASRLPAHIPIVHDPVLESGDGKVALVTPGTLDAMHTHLFPRVTMLTPNTIEATEIIKHFHHSRNTTSLQDLARATREVTGVRHLLLKAGHAPAPHHTLQDVLAGPDGATLLDPLPRIDLGPGVRGTGCQLSSALAAKLGMGEPARAACEQARKILAGWLAHRRFSPGQGRDVVGHFAIREE